ncbi:MAG: ribonuclease R [Epulopiscium sp.]|nr:ribonuclease R [Candidatus Epulonipiscium sp.]
MENDLREQRKEKVIGFIRHKEYHPMKLKELMSILQVPSQEKEDLEGILQELIQEGNVIQTKKGKYVAPERLNMIVGTFQGHPRGYGFLLLDDPIQEDIFIPAEFVGGALHQDRVLCRIIKNQDGGRRAEGEIVDILQRGKKEIVGTYEENKSFGFVTPDDRRFAQDIYIPKGSNKGAVTGHKVVVEITDWPRERRNPQGKVVEILGHINDPGVDILSIIREFQLPTEFPEIVWQQLETIPAEVVEEDIQGRADLRSLLTVTIDGEDAKDLDDAISLEKTAEGNYRLGVHIADVTHYVQEHTPVDEEAQKRATSVYLVDRVIPMLPHQLSNGICSLNAGENRLALSCIMEINPQGKVVDHRIVESVIQVDRRMSYTEIKKILEDQDPVQMEKHRDLVPFFQDMEDLASILRQHRMKRGSIDFNFEESKIILDDQGKVIEIKAYERNVATRIIEEFMLICNETIAEHYFWQEIPFVYRIHEEPDPEKIQKLSKYIYHFGYRIKGAGNVLHPKELQRLLQDIEGSLEEQVISRLILRSLKQAKYHTQNEGHFGLAAQYYCHFTAPIRRYPDLQIHRIIKEQLRGKLNAKRQKSLNKSLPEVSKHSSMMERVAEEAEREVEKLKKVEYMSDKIGDIYEGMISGITSWGLYVELPNTVEGLVHVTSLDDDYYIYDEEHHLFIGEHTKKIYRLGDRVKVEVVKADLIQRTIDFHLVP